MPLALRRMWIQMISDRRRFGILAAACLVGVLLWARVIIVAKPPRTAIADDASSSVERDSAVNGTARSRADKQAEPVAPVVLELIPRRDPFLINPQFFPRPTQPNPSGQEQAKSVSTTAEDAERGARRTEAIVAAAGGLKLEAVMKGAQLAVINGRTTRVGDRMHAGKDMLEFVLIEVGERSVMLECESRRIELEMPGASGLQGGSGDNR